MIGRQVLKLRNYYSLQELKERADAFGARETEECRIGRPTAASIEEYLLIPATEHYLVAAIMRRSGFFSRSNRLVLFVCDTVSGVLDHAVTSVRSKSILLGCKQLRLTHSLEEERKGPAEATLLAVTDCMREIFRDELL